MLDLLAVIAEHAGEAAHVGEHVEPVALGFMTPGKFVAPVDIWVTVKPND